MFNLILGDCSDKLKMVQDNSIDLICIDPPYITTKEQWDKKEVVDGMLSKELFRVAKDSCSLYVWCGIGEKSQSLIRWFPIFQSDWYFKDLITWKKQRGIGMRKGWLYTREECMWFVKDNKKFIWNKEEQNSNVKRQKYGFKTKCKSEFKRLTNIWDDIKEVSLTGIFGKQKPKNLLHFTPKPVKAIERIIKVHTKENDTVLDCFMGSGTTALACKNLKRQFIGIEINKNYYDIAQERTKDE